MSKLTKQFLDKKKGKSTKGETYYRSEEYFQLNDEPNYHNVNEKPKKAKWYSWPLSIFIVLFGITGMTVLKGILGFLTCVLIIALGLMLCPLVSKKLNENEMYKTNKKKIAIIGSVLAFFGIGLSPEDHTHDFQIVDCNSPATCECGETEGDVIGHDFKKDKVIDATCDQEGETIYVCTRCKEEKKEVIEKLDHEFEETIVKPTESEKGYTLSKCKKCGFEEKSNYTDPIKNTTSAFVVTDVPTNTETTRGDMGNTQSPQTSTPAPAPTPSPAPSTPSTGSNPATQPPATGEYCYITATGSSYHRINNCGKTNPAKTTKLTIAEAEQRGMSRCSKCW